MNKRVHLTVLGMILAGAVSLMVLPMVNAQPTTQPDDEIRIVKLKDGSELQGRVTRQGDEVIVETAKKKHTLAAGDVVSISEPPTPQEQFQKRFAAINADDSQGFYELARWAWQEYPDNEEMLRKAKGALDTVLEKKPAFTRAKLLLRQVQGKLDQLQAGSADSPAAAVMTPPSDQSGLVTQRDIYWIRLKELKKTDRVRIKYENDVLNRYINMMRGKEAYNWDRRSKETRFRNLSRMQQVMEMLDARPNDTGLQKDILVETDPSFMLTFRNSVWPMLESSCAQSSCHGGAKPKGGFKLFVTGDKDRVAYTNFIVLSCLELSGNRQLINRQTTEDSLIIQYGLPKEIGKDALRHPTKIPPTFRSIRTQRYRSIYDWIRGLKGPRAPDYEMDDYKPPFDMKIDTTGRPAMPFLGEPEKD